MAKGSSSTPLVFDIKLPDLTPSRDILRLYKDLGGKIITFGSDSHMEAHLGHQIKAVKQELKLLGFESFCTFDKMEPISHSL